MNDRYGVDPSTPASLADLGILSRLFACSEGRFILDFPNDWIERLRRHMNPQSDIESSRVEVLATRLRHGLLPATAIYEDCKSWGENASRIREQVVTLVGPLGSPATVECFRDLLEQADCFPPARGGEIPRTVAAYTAAAAPLFQVSPKVVMIDRYFRLRTPDGSLDRWRQPVLVSFLRAASRGRVECFRLVIDPKCAYSTDPTGAQLLLDVSHAAELAGAGKVPLEFGRFQRLVLLCHKRSLALTRRQHGHRGSVLSKAAAIRSRKVVMDDGTWRCVRWAAARLVMRG